MYEMNFAPTPVQKVFTDENGNTVFLKREDLLPYSFGGNKVRIALEYMRDMHNKGCNHMVAYGNARSNLCRVLSNLCAGAGVPITILSPADDDGQRRQAYNEKLCRAFGAEVVPCLKTGVAESVDQVLESIRQKGDKPYYIYGDRFGKGNEAVPTAAYVPVYDEIRKQGDFDVIALACGTGMTLGGLLCGRHLRGGSEEIIGISVARDAQNARAHTLAYANAWLGGDVLSDADIRDDFRRVYGDYGADVENAIRQMMQNHGVPMDGTYVGKAYHGLMEIAKQEGWQNKKILFIHTGGTPLFFDAADRIW